METIAITGSTGGLGNEAVKKLVNDYNLILVNRSLEKSNIQKQKLLKINPNAKIDILLCDMEDINSVKDVTNKLIEHEIDYFIVNAGILTGKKTITSFNYDNVFTTNFLAPYYIINRLKENNLPKVKVIAMGSVAHRWGKLDLEDIDHKNYKSKNKRYGNSKRFLMASLIELYKDKPEKLVIAHPGISLTNMTKNYNKVIKWFTIVFLSIFFQGKKKASRCIVKAIDSNTTYLEWVGPHIFGVYGKPKVCKIKHLRESEIIEIYKVSTKLYDRVKAL